MVSMKVDAARRALRELNERFQGRELVAPAFYAVLMASGFAYARCVLVTLVPEGANTFTGKIIRQDGRVFDFDVDLASAGLTTWSDVTEEFQSELKSGRMKPWSAERVAYDEHVRMLSTIGER